MMRLFKPFRAAAVPRADPPAAAAQPAAPAGASAPPAPCPADDVERLAGGEHYRSFLARAHATLAPRTYLEIGVWTGASLSLAACRAVAVDPEPQLAEQGPLVELHAKTADDFFALDAATALRGGHDLAFIDGLHLFDFVLRDFLNAERFAHPAGVIVLDDIYPNHPAQASRHRHTLTWMGDVWKLADCLARYRPELTVAGLDTWPSGLLFVAGLDPDSTVLRERGGEILSRYLGSEYDVVPDAVIARRGAVDPASRWLQETMAFLRDARERALPAAEIRRTLAALRR